MVSIIIVLAIFFAVIAQSEAVCYDTGGTAKDNFLPCNASAEVSVCCGRNDYCLDNGLCLDAGGDNIFTVQGCTSRTWDAPCIQYCPDMPPTTNWYQDLTLCRTNDRDSGEYCCGEDASCCDDTTSYITISLFPGVYRGMNSEYIPSGSIPSESTPRGSTPISTSQPLVTSSDKQTLGLRLGLGLGLGLGLLALALLFVGWQLRKRNKLRKKASLAAPQYPIEYGTDAVNKAPLPELGPGDVMSELPGDARYPLRP